MTGKDLIEWIKRSKAEDLQVFVGGAEIDGSCEEVAKPRPVIVNHKQSDDTLCYDKSHRYGKVCIREDADDKCEKYDEYILL